VRIEEAKRNFLMEVRWRAFPLHPDTPEEGLTLEELFAGRDIDIPAVLTRLKKVAGELGLPWGERKRTYNSRLAQELGKWAETQGKGDAFHQSVFHAYFVEGWNIAKKDALSRLAESVGLPGEEAEEVLESRRFKAAVDEDWSLSRQRGITAVPTFVLDGAGLVGAQPYEALAQFLTNQEVPKRVISLVR
jgi:predicted DsbA family dithiol-disulfide isomerase